MASTSQLDQRKRRRLLTLELADAVKPFGFSHCGDSYFSRERNDLVDAFFFQFTRTNFRFCIAYGIDGPKLLPEIRENSVLGLDSGNPSLLISCWLADQEDFGCKYEDHIKNSGIKVKGRFQKEAIPWFNRFQTAEDIITEYHRKEIRSDAPVTTDAPHLVLRWTIYGLMLYNIGRSNEARPWLDCAYKQWSNTTKPTEHETEWCRIIASTEDGTEQHGERERD